MEQPPPNRPPLSAPGGDFNNPNFGDGVNTSGQPGAVLPAELQGVNFGAFLLNWVWAIAHNYWLGLLCLVPCANLVMPFYMLFKGNEAAWQSRRFESIAQFREVQHKWMLWGVGLTVTSCVLYGVAIAILVATGAFADVADVPAQTSAF